MAGARVSDTTAQAGAPDRPIEHVEQRWFVGAHANVGGGYASDPLAQRPLKWLMDKAAGLGLVFRDQIVIDTLISKYCDHTPLYRQNAIRKRATSGL